MWIASAACIISGGLASLIGFAASRNKAFFESLPSYTALEYAVERNPTTASELNKTIAEGQSVYPVVITGQVECTSPDGKLLQPQYGEKKDSCFCVYFDVRSPQPKVRQLPMFVRDLNNPEEGVYLGEIPSENILADLHSQDQTGSRQEYIVPFKSSVTVVGRAQKVGDKLVLNNSPTHPLNLFRANKDQILQHKEDLDLLILQHAVASWTYSAIGILLLGLGSFFGWRHYKNSRRNTGGN